MAVLKPVKPPSAGITQIRFKGSAASVGPHSQPDSSGSPGCTDRFCEM